MRSSVLVHSALSGAVMAGIVGLLVVGAATIVASVVALPSALARLLDRRGVMLAALVLFAFVAGGAILGYLEGRHKLR